MGKCEALYNAAPNDSIAAGTAAVRQGLGVLGAGESLGLKYPKQISAKLYRGVKCPS